MWLNYYCHINTKKTTRSCNYAHSRCGCIWQVFSILISCDSLHGGQSILSMTGQCSAFMRIAQAPLITNAATHYWTADHLLWSLPLVISHTRSKLVRRCVHEHDTVIQWRGPGCAFSSDHLEFYVFFFLYLFPPFSCWKDTAVNRLLASRTRKDYWWTKTSGNKPGIEAISMKRCFSHNNASD